MLENPFLDWIRSHTPAHPQVPLNVGDDMAAVMVGGRWAGARGWAAKSGLSGLSPQSLVLLKIDQALDQVHFDLREHSATQAGRKAVNRCLSDCAAMACLPAAVMISVALPREASEAFAQELFLACQSAAAAFDCPLVGGDTAIWDQRLVITVAAMGRSDHLPLTRSGAKAGDTLFVSGRLGGSILGRHLSFTPRIRLAEKLARTAKVHAMMDLSDGLAQDLPRLCTASGVGAIVYPHLLPIHEDAQTLAGRDQIPAGLHALADGEDYELLFAIDPNDVPTIIPISEQGGVPLTAIGTITGEKALVLETESGVKMPWPKAGWEHGGE